MVVLAEYASQVAAICSNREGAGVRHEMPYWLFLDWIYLQGSRIAIGKGDHFSVVIASDRAEASCALG